MATLMPGARGAVPGAQEFEELVSVGMTGGQGQGEGFLPRLAETVPSTENGLWVVNPDGSMRVTWKIRSDAVFHDGTPVTAQDFLFKTQLEQDDRIPFVDPVIYRTISSIEAPDPKTVVVNWNRPYLQGDKGLTFPLPRHILEAPYQTGEIERFNSLPYWTNEWIGTGPYRMRQWNVGSGAILDAFDGYFLGRPKIDTIEIKFIVDTNTIAANLLAGEVDVTLGGRLAVDWAQGLKERSGGSVTYGTNAANPLVMYVNFMNPVPAALADVQFRRALVHAIDRQSMVDGLVGGTTSVAHRVITNPSRAAEFQAASASIVQYEYDPRKAVQMIEALGFRKAGDGVYRDPAGQAAPLEIRTITQGDIQQERSMNIVSGNWREIGLAAEESPTPAARRSDFEYRFNFPAFDLRRQPLTFDQLYDKFHSSQFTTAANNYRGGNYGKYANAELDRLVEQHQITIPQAQRWDLFKQIVRHVTDQVVIIGLFYDVEVTATTSRLKNVRTRSAGFGETLNVTEWDLA
jgi:peptide/nickel transport system substrate-binding protein